jgi:hypothetical protein
MKHVVSTIKETKNVLERPSNKMHIHNNLTLTENKSINTMIYNKYYDYHSASPVYAIIKL